MHGNQEPAGDGGFSQMTSSAISGPVTLAAMASWPSTPFAGRSATV